MSVACTGSRLVRGFVRKVDITVAELPVFLCPGLSRLQYHQYPVSSSTNARATRLFQTSARRGLADTVSVTEAPGVPTVPREVFRALPLQCSGCGALSQSVDPDEAGYYGLNRGQVKSYLGMKNSLERSAEDDIVKAALENAGEAAANLKLDILPKPGMLISPKFQ